MKNVNPLTLQWEDPVTCELFYWGHFCWFCLDPLEVKEESVLINTKFRRWTTSERTPESSSLLHGKGSTENNANGWRKKSNSVQSYTTFDQLKPFYLIWKLKMSIWTAIYIVPSFIWLERIYYRLSLCGFHGSCRCRSSRGMFAISRCVRWWNISVLMESARQG